MIPSITTICRQAKLVFYLCPCLEHKGSAICSITMQHLINRRKFTSWNYFDSNCVQTRFEIIIFFFCLRSIRIDTVYRIDVPRWHTFWHMHA